MSDTHRHPRLTRIEIENFKGIRETATVEFRPITLLFGANSAGKSTIVHALLYFRELLEKRNADTDSGVDPRHSIKLGGFRNMVHGHDLSQNIRLRLWLDPGDSRIPTYNRPAGCSLDIKELIEVESLWVELTVGMMVLPGTCGKHGAGIKEYRVGINSGDYLARVGYAGGTWDGYFSTDKEHPLMVEALRIEPDLEFFVDNCRPDGFYNWDEWGYSGAPFPEWGKRVRAHADSWDIFHKGEYNKRSVFEHFISQLLVGPGDLVLEQLQRLCYIGPLRTVPDETVAQLDRSIRPAWYDGGAAWDIMAARGPGAKVLEEEDPQYDPDSDPPLIDEVNEHLGRLGAGYELVVDRYQEVPLDSGLIKDLELLASGYTHEDPASDASELLKKLKPLPVRSRVGLRDQRNNVLLRPTDAGCGVSQCIPILVAACLDYECGYLAVEQPELHLHPAMQCSLADVFISAIRKGEPRLILLETHSEHLLLRLLRRVRESDENPSPALSADELSVIYVMNGETGTHLTTLAVTPDGDFASPWPEGFFEERVEELF